MTDKCERCGGEGWYVEPQHAPTCSPESGCEPWCPIAEQVQCRDCNGTGKIQDYDLCARVEGPDRKDECPHCEGTGRRDG